MLIHPEIEWVNKVIPANWFQLIFDRFFPLKTQHRNVLNEWKKDHLSEYSYVISIQIRAQLPTGGPGYTKTDHWFAPPLTVNEIWFQAAELLTHALPFPSKKVAWFLATQDEKIIEWFRNQRQDGPIITYESEKVFAFDKGKISGKLAGQKIIN